MQALKRWDDRRAERVIGELLRLGVLLAGVVTLVGGVVFLARHGTEGFDYGVFRGEPSDLRNVRGVVAAAWSGRGRGVIQLGLLLLLATPVARVAFSIFVFALQRDRLCVAATLLVLAALAFSLAGGQL
jgi:uncharacterized membrane protein